MKRLTGFVFLAALCLGQTGRTSGVDRAGMDLTCKPCQDFWRYANGTYVDQHPIPARYSRWGTFLILRDANAERMKTVLDSAASNPNARGNERIVGQFYAACMNQQAIDVRGAEPIEADLKRIAAIQSRENLIAELVSLEIRGDVNPVRVGPQPDPSDATQTITGVQASGLSLPERDYYFRDDERSKRIRDEFTRHVARMLTLAGGDAAGAGNEAGVVLQFETVLARATLTNVQARDPYMRVHRMDFAGLRGLAPDYNWQAAFKALGVPEGVAINVSQPEFLKTFGQQLTSAPLETWKTWLRWRIVNDRAQFLSKNFYDEWFHFRQEVLTGVKEQLPRWHVCALEADQRLGDALGRLFVDKYFQAEARRRMTELVENLRASLGDELNEATWLEPETRKNALKKLDAFKPLIGYPDHWRDYSPVKIEVSDYSASEQSAAMFNRHHGLAQIGQKVDRSEMRMTPPTVNASYSPPTNVITFPAGILQPPFFQPDADDAANYGAIGAVIGHEMGHGFDDQGSKYDADGNLKNWWTDEDRRKFEQRAACVTSQFDSIDVGEGLPHHKGKLVTGEAMGDLGGITLAYKAYHRSLNGKESPVIDGMTGDQRFFLAYARIWADIARPEEQILLLNTDPHPVEKFRANATLSNLPEFQKAFQCQAGDPMARPAAQRCRLW